MKRRWGVQHIDVNQSKLTFGWVGCDEADSDRMIDEVMKMERIHGAQIVSKEVEHHSDGSSTITLRLDGDSFMRGRDDLKRAESKYRWLVGQLTSRQLLDMGLLRWQDRHISVHEIDETEIHAALDERFENFERATNRLTGQVRR